MTITDLQKKTAQAIVNIFETGSVKGRYGSIGVIPGDAGHLSFGRAQASLGSGQLYTLLLSYTSNAGALYKDALVPYLLRVQQKDFTLDMDQGFRLLLHQIGEDPAMHTTEDEFFDIQYWNRVPGLCDARQIQSALGAAVIYDSLIQGGLGLCSAHMPIGMSGNPWVLAYISARRAWLAAKPVPVCNTTYRMDAFEELATDANWDLELPITVRGIQITEDLL